jgi:hypothetical protein
MVLTLASHRAHAGRAGPRARSKPGDVLAATAGTRFKGRSFLGAGSGSLPKFTAIPRAPSL